MNRKKKPEAQWITVPDLGNMPNQWLAFHCETKISRVQGAVRLRVAVDSKYWLWINNRLVVREGGLKRTCAKDHTYADHVDIAKHLQEGINRFLVVVWFFGKGGISHLSSGNPGLFIDCDDLPVLKTGGQ